MFEGERDNLTRDDVRTLQEQAHLESGVVDPPREVVHRKPELAAQAVMARRWAAAFEALATVEEVREIVRNMIQRAKKEDRSANTLLNRLLGPPPQTIALHEPVGSRPDRELILREWNPRALPTGNPELDRRLASIAPLRIATVEVPK